jgi:hypothetical protein
MSRRRIAPLFGAFSIWLVLTSAPAWAAHIVHSSEGTFNGADTPGGPFQYVLGVEVDNSGGSSDGDVYVAEMDEEGETLTSTVHKFDEDGSYAGVEINGTDTPQGQFSFFAPGSFALSFDGLAVSNFEGANKGDVYVADLEHGVVDRFNEAGEYLCQITGRPTPSVSECAGSAGSATPDGGFLPTAVAVSATNGDLYVADVQHRVINKFDESGTYIGQIADPRITQPASIDLDSTGALYVLNNWYYSGENVIKFNSAGTFISVVDSNEPIGVGVAPSTDYLYITHGTEGRVTEYSPMGNSVDIFGSGIESTYGSIAVSNASGRIYVGNFYPKASVDIYSPDIFLLDAITQAATKVGETTATLNGSVDPAKSGDVVSCEFEYGPTTSYGQSAPCLPVTPYSSPTAVAAEVGGLLASASYHFRLHIANAVGLEDISEDKVLYTHGPPTIDEQSASDVERTAASLRGMINPHGLDTEYKFEYVDAEHFNDDGGFSSPATRSTLSSELGNGVRPLAAGQGIAGLSIGTTYHYRAVATNSAGTVEGPSQTFATLPVVKIEGQWAYAHVKSATVEAKIAPLGLDTSCHVQYVDDAEFQRTGYSTAEIKPCMAGLGSGFGMKAAIGRAELKGLNLSTTYHFRFVATNQSGKLAGDDEAFATFGIESFSVEPIDNEGNPYTQAGGHPYERITHYGFNHTFVPTGSGSAGSINAFIKDIITELAPGQTGGNANGIPKCPGYKVEEEACDRASQVGTVTIEYVNGGGVGTRTSALFNVVPPEGVASRYATVDPYTATDSHVRTGDDYGSTASGLNITEEARVVGATVIVWGVPADHNQSGFFRSPVLRNPTTCTGPLKAHVSVDSWQLPGEYATASTEMPATTGCDKLEFHPSIEWQPTTNAANSPTGLHVDVHQAQNDDPDGLAFADLEDAVMNPAEGLVLNPAGASGLVGCSPNQISLHEETPAHCPDASKVGRAEIDTPLVDHPLLGGIYIATPHDNPFDSMFAIYIAVSDPRTGVAVKLAGNIQANSHDGQLTSHFSETPQLPVDDFKLDFFGGPRSVLRTPAECGTYVTESILTPWSAPQSGPPAHPTDSYEITSSPNGGACVDQEADAPNKVEFRAGTINPVAGTYTPFVMLLRREDGTQRIADIRVTPPPGLLGRLAGILRCSDAAIAAAEQHSGMDERINPSCPANSQVGTVIVGAGAGTDPYFVNGKTYLGGPYRGTPLSLAVIVPVVAGPFDLGTVVVRTPLRIDLESGQVKVESDPIPTIIEGVPLDVRAIAVKLDRPKFTLNPTNCDPTETTANVTSLPGQSLALRDLFQVGECDKLGFAPKVDLRLLGKTGRRAHSGLRAVLKMPKSGANIARIAVTMPPTEFLDTEHIRGICTRQQFAADACPANSVYGRAEAWSPLLDKPLSGPVFMRSSVHRLPDLVTELNGEFRLALPARMGSAHGGVQANVDSLPDVPVTKFVMTMRGKGRGLLQNSVDACDHLQRALIEMEAQNGKIAVLHPLLRAKCSGAAGHREHRGG